MIRLTLICLGVIAISTVLVGRGNAKIDEESLVGAWLFNENGGKKAADSSGNGYDGALVGGAKFVKGRFGNAIELMAKTLG